jgi:hypothetical protein
MHRPLATAATYAAMGLLCLTAGALVVLAGYLHWLALGRVLFFGVPDRVYLPGYLTPASYACYSGAAMVLAVLCGIGVRRLASLLSPGLED